MRLKKMKITQLNTIILLFILSLSFSSCTKLGPDFKNPETKLPPNWNDSENSAFKKPSAEESMEWWKLFSDPVLDNLIQTAYEQNLSLQTAGLRILESRAQLGLVKGNLYPQTQEMKGDLTTIGTTGPAADRYFNSASVGFDAGWEIDFWGKFRRSIESADANLLASIADYDDVLVTLTAEVARTYIDIRTLEERIRLAVKNGLIQKNALELVMHQFEAGTVTELDVLQAKTLLSSTRATIPNLQNQLQQNRNAMAILLGVFPGEFQDLLKGEERIPTVSLEIAVGIPADLLRRRPDIRKLEMQAAAQSAQIGVAITELYPSFTLFGSLGWSASDSAGNSLGDIFESNSFSYSFGPAFRWKLFQYGRLKNQVRIQDARLEQLISIYQNTVLNAAREVEDGMTGLVYKQKEAQFVGQGVKSSKRSMELSILQYQEGLADYQRVLDSTRALTQKQDQFAQLQGSIATSFVSIYKALGGGWQLRGDSDFIPASIKEKMQKRTDWGTYFSTP